LSFFLFQPTLVKRKDPIIYRMHGMVETEKDELSLYKRLNTQIQSVHMCSKMSYEIEMVPLSRVSIILAHYLLGVKVRRPWPSTQEGKKYEGGNRHSKEQETWR
jgi:hypothetical protein